MRKWIKYAAFAVSGAYLLSRLFVKKEEENVTEVIEEDPSEEKQEEENSEEAPEEEQVFEKEIGTELLKQERLLSLQVDLVLANYPEEKKLVLKQDISFHDRSKLEDLINAAQKDGYQISFSEEALQLSRIADKEAIKEEVLDIARKTRRAGALYRGFDVRPE